MVKDFLEALGKPAAVARELNVPLPTVAAWQQRNSIPHWRIPSLVALAMKKGVPIPQTLREAA